MCSWYNWTMNNDAASIGPVTPKNYLTHPRLRNLLTLPQRLQHRSPMMRRICEELYVTPDSTRADVMSRIHTSAKATSNGCYWRRIHAGRRPDVHDDARYSVLVNGLVEVSGKTRTGRYTYRLTAAGLDLVRGI